MAQTISDSAHLYKTSKAFFVLLFFNELLTWKKMVKVISSAVAGEHDQNTITEIEKAKYESNSE